MKFITHAMRKFRIACCAECRRDASHDIDRAKKIRSPLMCDARENHLARRDHDRDRIIRSARNSREKVLAPKRRHAGFAFRCPRGSRRSIRALEIVFSTRIRDSRGNGLF
ncbi:MAG TPA: hypothetical protein VGF92_21465 [Stellaceae bacterium]